MRTVWKYKLFMGTTNMVLPKGSKVVHVGEQNANPHIWVEQEAEDNVDGFECAFYVVGTGNALPSGDTFLGHVGSYTSGPFVWHVYMGW